MAHSLNRDKFRSTNNLSMLAKGQGDFYDAGKRVEIVLDDIDKDESSFSQFQRYKSFINTNRSFPVIDKLLSNSKQELSLPKTYTTKKGALVLFSEDVLETGNDESTFSFFEDDSFIRNQSLGQADPSKSKEDVSSKDIKTVNDLQHNLLSYPGNAPIPKDDSAYIKNFFLSTKRLEKETESIKERLSRANQEAPKQIADTKPAEAKRIQRGFSAKRYLNNLTKNWDQSVLDTFVNEGKIKNLDKPMTGQKRKLSYDMSIWPQAYRIDQNWATAAVDMKSYKFVKANEFNISESRMHGQFDQKHEVQKSEHLINMKFDSGMHSYQSVEDDEQSYIPNAKKTKAAPVKTVVPDAIKVYDSNQNEINYKDLEMNEKEKVLSELLFHSAMNNIMEMTDLRDTTISYTMERDYADPKSPDKIKKSLNELNTQSISSLAFSKAAKYQNDLQKRNETFDETIKFPGSALTRSSGRYNESDPVNMFGKFISAPLGKKPLPNIASSNNNVNKNHDGSTQPASNETKISPKNASVSKPNEYKQATLTHLQPQLDISFSGDKQIKSYQSFAQSSASVSRSMSKIFNPLASSGRWRKMNSGRYSGASNRLSQSQSHLSDVTKKYENIIADTNQENTSPTRLNFVLPLDKSNPSIIVKERLSSSQYFNNQESFIMQNEKKSARQQILHEGKSKVILGRTEASENPSPTKMDFYDLPDDLDRELNRKKLGSYFDSMGNVVDSDETYKTPIEYYLEELKSTRDEFALDSQSNSLASFDNDGSFVNIQNAGGVEMSQQKSTENLNRVANLDMHLKNFKAKKKHRTSKSTKQKIDLNYTDNVDDEKLLIKQQQQQPLDKGASMIMRANRKEETLKEKMQRIKKKPNSLLPPIESRLETEFSTKQTPKTEEKQVNQKDSLILIDETIDSKEEFSRSKNASINQAAKNAGLPVPKMADLEAEILKQNINTDVVMRELTLEEKAEKMDSHPSELNNTSYEKPDVPKREAKKLIFLEDENDEYARVDTITLGKKPDKSEYIKKMAQQSNEVNQTKPTNQQVNTGTSYKQQRSEPYQLQDWSRADFNNLPDKKTVPATNKLTKEDLKAKLMAPIQQRRKIDWSIGDFDPRECFLLWSYEKPPEPIVVDRAFAHMLRRYAELLAKTILGKKFAGVNLSEDIRRALRENLQKLMDQIAKGKISREVLEEYKRIFKKVLAKLLKRNDLDMVEISDEMLIKLLEHPCEAFEIYLDETSGKESLRLKESYLAELAKLLRTVVTEVGLDVERDFDVYIDPVTGEKKYKLKADVARKLGIPEGAEDMFEVYIDEDGNQQIRLKGGNKTITIGDTEYELVIDPTTGKQVLRMITKQKVGQETLEDIMRLAANMSPNSRNRYFQELLKTSGATMSDEMRRRIIEEMMANAQNLSEEDRENMLKDLMTNLVNFLPAELAQKVLADIMKATEDLDPELKEKMIRNMLNNLEDLPEGLRDAAIKQILKNMDNLSSEQKQKLLENILSKVEELGINTKESQDLKNQVLKEMLINAQNFDEETRQRIIADVLAKAMANGQDVPQSILEELVKQMNSLPDDMKNVILKEVKKALESGNLDAAVLSELLKNPENLTEDMLAAIAANAGKMDANAMKELIKNLDKLPDHMKMDVLNKMMEGGQMDSEAMKELMRNMDKLPDHMKKEVLKKMMEKMDSAGFQELMKNIDSLPDDLKRDVINKMFEKMDAGALGELVMNLDKLSDEMKNEVIGKMLENFDNLDSSVKQKLLKELLNNPDLIQDKELREKILKDIMKSLTLESILRDIEGMTPSEKNAYFQNLLKRAGDLSDELRSKIIEMMIKNAEFLDPEERDNLMKNFMANIVKYLDKDMQEKVLADLMKNTEFLDAETKKRMIDNMLANMDDLPPELKQMALGELVKNLDDLSAEDKERIFKNILASVDSLPAEFRDKTLKAMIDNMGNFSAELKNQLLQDILDKVEAGGGNSEFAKNLRNDVIKEILKNSQNLDEETRKKVLKGVMDKLGDGEVPDVILQELVKQLDTLPDEYKNAVYKEIKKNIAKGNMDAKVLEELLKNGNIPQDILESLVANAANLNPEAYAALVKNLDKLPDHLKEKALKDMLDNIANLDPTVQKELLNELLKNPNLIKDKAAYEKAILGLMDNLDAMPENVRRDMMKNIAKNINQLSKEAKEKVLKEVFKNLENSTQETRKDVLKQLLKNMGQKELEEWIKNSDLSEEEKQKMLDALKNIIESDDLLWDSDDERELEGLSFEERERKKKDILAKRRKEKEEGKGRWADSLRKLDKTIVKDASWLKNQQATVLKNILGATGPIDKLSDEQMDFIKAFNMLSEEEKQKYLANLTEEERAAILGLQTAYEAVHYIKSTRLKELHDVLAQAKAEAVRKLREKLALKKQLDYINMFRVEKSMFQHAQQISRAFVFSYFDMLQWLQVGGGAETNDIPLDTGIIEV